MCSWILRQAGSLPSQRAGEPPAAAVMSSTHRSSTPGPVPGRLNAHQRGAAVAAPARGPCEQLERPSPLRIALASNSRRGAATSAGSATLAGAAGSGAPSLLATSALDSPPSPAAPPLRSSGAPSRVASTDPRAVGSRCTRPGRGARRAKGLTRAPASISVRTSRLRGPGATAIARHPKRSPLYRRKPATQAQKPVVPMPRSADFPVSWARQKRVFDAFNHGNKTHSGHRRRRLPGLSPV